MLTAAAIEGYKKYTERAIDHAEVRIGNSWQTKTVRKERMKDGRVAIYVSIIPQSQTSVTVTGIRLYDTKGNIWAEKAESITIREVQNGVLYRFTFDLHEEEM